MTSESNSNQKNESLPVLSRASGPLPGHPGALFEDDLASSYQENVSGRVVAPLHRDPVGMILTAVIRYRWTVLAVFLITSVVSVFSVWKTLIPQYNARAVVRVSPVGVKLAFRTEANEMVPLYQSFLNTQVSIIRGPSVLERVLDDPKVRATAWFQDVPRPMFGNKPTDIERLLENLSVAPRPQTELIDVAMTAADGGDAKLIADMVVDVYQTYSNEMMAETELSRTDTLQKQKESLEREMDGLVAIKSNLTAQVGAADPVERLSQASARLAALEVEYDTLERRLALARWELGGIPESNSESGDTKSPSANGVEDPESALTNCQEETPADYPRDAEWQLLKRSLATARLELELGKQQYGPLHPQIKELELTVLQREGLVREREEELDAQARAGFLDPADRVASVGTPSHRDTLQREVDRLSNELTVLNAILDKARTRVKDLGQITKDMSRYDEELRHKRESHELIRARVEELSLERKAPARITVAGYAVKPTKPSRDRRLILTVMCVMGSMALGLGLGYLRLVLDGTVRDRADVQVPSTARLLGRLPLLPEAIPLASSCTPPVLESMRMVRTVLFERIDPAKSNALLVTSSSSHAGKTTVSYLLAGSLASLGKRVLLVEADLRRPSLAGRLGLDAERGLGMMLGGEATDDDGILSPAAMRFDLLPAGRAPEGFSPDLLANGVMASALNRWKQKYDFVVLDSPPAPPVADAGILGRICDGTVVVVRYSHCRRTEVSETYGSLAMAGCRVIGTILIGGDEPRSNYDYYGGAYGYGGDVWGSRQFETYNEETERS